jgi:hypothetical protein
MTAHGTAVFGEAVRMVGDAPGIKLDEVRCDAEYPIMTATHRCTIAAVAAAAPGIVIYNGVPLILPRGVAELT